MWILERRFSEDFGRREYRKTNIVSENLNQNIERGVKDADKIKEKILEKFARLENARISNCLNVFIRI